MLEAVASPSSTLREEESGAERIDTGTNLFGAHFFRRS
jgi:hypothetical protein